MRISHLPSFGKCDSKPTSRLLKVIRSARRWVPSYRTISRWPAATLAASSGDKYHGPRSDSGGSALAGLFCSFDFIDSVANTLLLEILSLLFGSLE